MPSATVNWDHCLAYAASTDVGMRRSNNEDSHSVIIAGDYEHYLQRGHVFLVADGMGFHAAGELASKLAADGVPHLYQKHKQLSPPEALVESITETNSEIHRRGEANAEFSGMGTTVSTLVLLPQGAFVAHVGDSRVYRLRGGKLEQLTFDHSLVWEMKHGSPLAEELDLKGLVSSNVITRCLGPKDKVQVDIEGPYPIQLGDTFLLCSDGLSGQVTDEEIGPMLAALQPREAVRALIDLANLRGGPDNITVIVAKVTGQDLVTGAVAAEPIVVGSERQERTVHPALWVMMGVCFLAAVVFSITGWAISALVVGAGGLVALTSILLQLYGGLGKGEVVLVGDKRLGKGPYTEAPGVPGEEVVGKFSKLVSELIAATDGQSWSIDRGPFDEHVQLARTAEKNSKPAQALREYAHAISYMMQELRAQRKRKKTSDSGIDL